MNLLGDQLQNGAGDLNASVELRPQNGDACLQIRRLNVGDEPHLKARPEAVFQSRDRLRGPVTREDDLPTTLMYCIKCMEKLFLCTLFTGDELYIIDHQEAGTSISRAKLVRAVLPNGLN